MKPKLTNKQIKKIAKQIKSYTPEEFDDVLEQDEAHQEFMRGEEERQMLVSGLHSGDYDAAYKGGDWESNLERKYEEGDEKSRASCI